MKKMKLSLIALFLLLSIDIYALRLSDQPVQLWFFNEGVAIPFTAITGKNFNPGWMIGTEIDYIQNKTFNLFQNLRLGYYIHPSLQHGIFLNTEIGARYTFQFGLLTELSGGIAYSHNFTARKVYELDENNEYIEVADRGRSQFTPSFSIGVGYNFFNKLDFPLSIVFQYRCFFDIPYSTINNIPVLPHVSIGINTRFSL